MRTNHDPWLTPALTTSWIKFKSKPHFTHQCTARSRLSHFSFRVTWQKLSPEKVYHVLVAPCFDKKLEAVREEFYNSLLETRDVDCVLTSGSLTSSPTHLPTQTQQICLFNLGLHQKQCRILLEYLESTRKTSIKRRKKLFLLSTWRWLPGQILQFTVGFTNSFKVNGYSRDSVEKSTLSRIVIMVLGFHFHSKLNWKSANQACAGKNGLWLNIYSWQIKKNIILPVIFFLSVSGEIYCLMEQRKISVEELDSVPLDHV